MTPVRRCCPKKTLGIGRISLSLFYLRHRIDCRGRTMLFLQPLGDQAVLAYCSDETAALRFAADVRAANPDWLIDVVGAYTSVAVFFDLDQTNNSQATSYLKELGEGTGDRPGPAGPSD